MKPHISCGEMNFMRLWMTYGTVQEET